MDIEYERDQSLLSILNLVSCTVVHVIHVVSLIYVVHVREILRGLHLLIKLKKITSPILYTRYYTEQHTSSMFVSQLHLQ